MGLRDRLEKLERRETGEWDPRSISRAALRLLSDEDLEALEEALDPELVWLAHEHEPWRPRTA